MWQQAELSSMVLAPLDGNGWVRDNGNLDIFGDTLENRKKVKEKVRLLLNGCGCKSGCRTSRCGCMKIGSVCGPGCRCINCGNIDDVRGESEEEHNNNYNPL